MLNDTTLYIYIVLVWWYDILTWFVFNLFAICGNNKLILC